MEIKIANNLQKKITVFADILNVKTESKLTFCIHHRHRKEKLFKEKYVITEYSTGIALVKAFTRDDAIEQLKAYTIRHSDNEILTQAKKILKLNNMLYPLNQ